MKTSWNKYVIECKLEPLRHAWVHIMQRQCDLGLTSQDKNYNDALRIIGHAMYQVRFDHD